MTSSLRLLLSELNDLAQIHAGAICVFEIATAECERIKVYDLAVRVDAIYHEIHYISIMREKGDRRRRDYTAIFKRYDAETDGRQNFVSASVLKITS